ncbi:MULTISPECIES: hypothetical protein [Bacillaceae]|uniref:Uncharacterized protein n=1 Tax=Evansella alkalicola TaxID=745819 RepID=A0ABS6JWN5_9BACI|nr:MULTISPECIES: hypothetical protein [Bacillaceae]MBU9723002.1 hypothetical protein [Bacillus alkalicola]
MQFMLVGPASIIEVIISYITLGLIIYLIYRYYQKQKNQDIHPKAWKACLATLVGVFTFSINIPMFRTMIEIPILPIGVWVLLWYASSRKGAWAKYRPFAWLGFYANFLFIVSALMNVFVHDIIYPKGELSTYIGDYENGVIIQLHPSAKDVNLDKTSLDQQLGIVEEVPVNNMEWYHDMVTFDMEDSEEKEEQFPYLLSRTSSRWGSGIPTLIYVEKDGRGFLIDSPYDQRYFRTDESILKGGNIE